MLREGYNEEDIAKAFTDKLNSAIQTVGAETAYQSLADAWNGAVDVYCRSKKIPEAKEYHITSADVVSILSDYIDLARLFDTNVEKLSETKDVIKEFFKQIGL